MKQKVKNYLSLPYTVLVRENEDGSFFAQIAELHGCWAEGKTEKEAREILEEAKRLWIETQIEDNQPIPEPRESLLHIQLDEYSWLNQNSNSIINESSERVFSDSVWTHNLYNWASDYIFTPQSFLKQAEDRR